MGGGGGAEGGEGRFNSIAAVTRRNDSPYCNMNNLSKKIEKCFVASHFSLQ